MLKLVPVVLLAAAVATQPAVAQLAPPGDIAPNPASPGAKPEPRLPEAPIPPPPATGERLAPLAPSAVGAGPAAPVLTEEEAKAWIDRTVQSSDLETIGEVVAILRDGSGRVTELHAEVGGFLGLGATRVRLTPDQFTFEGDRVVLAMNAETAKRLPPLPR